MKVAKTEKITITLQLEEREAKWLKDLVQNPLCDPVDEERESRIMRKKFWNALSKSLPQK